MMNRSPVKWRQRPDVTKPDDLKVIINFLVILYSLDRLSDKIKVEWIEVSDDKEDTLRNYFRIYVSRSTLRGQKESFVQAFMSRHPGFSPFWYVDFFTINITISSFYVKATRTITLSLAFILSVDVLKFIQYQLDY